MSIPYPRRPWLDGQTFEFTSVDGITVEGRYDLSKNAWSFQKFNDSISDIDYNDIFTDTVQTVALPFNAVSGGVPQSPKLIQDLSTQYDVNWFFADQISQNQAQIDWLQQQIAGIIICQCPINYSRIHLKVLTSDWLTRIALKYQSGN